MARSDDEIDPSESEDEVKFSKKRQYDDDEENDDLKDEEEEEDDEDEEVSVSTFLIDVILLVWVFQRLD